MSTTIMEDITHASLAASMDKRRRIGAHDSQETIEYLYRLQFYEPDIMLKGLLKVIGIERTIVSGFIEDYISGYYEPSPRSDVVEVWEEGPLKEYVKDMYSLYCDFRNMVTNRFLKLSNSAAAKNQWAKSQQGLVSDVGDNENNYYLSVIRAVDKFDPSKGTLAGYVQLWLNNATGSDFSMYLGEAFPLTRSVRLQIFKGQLNVNNKSYPMENAQTIPQTETRHLAEESHSYVEMLSRVQEDSRCRLAMFLSGFDYLITSDRAAQLFQLQKQKHIIIPSGWSLPDYDLEEMPVLSPAKRSPRTTKDKTYD